MEEGFRGLSVEKVRGSVGMGSPYLGAIEGRGLERDWVIVRRIVS